MYHKSKGNTICFCFCRLHNLHYEQFADGTVKCIEDEIPFELPDGWAWARLGVICPYGENKAVSADLIDETSWILDLEDIEKETGVIKKYATKSKRNSVSNKYSFYKGQLLYSKLRPYLNKVVIAPKDGYCTTEILPLTFYGNIYSPYMQLFIMSPTFLTYVNMISYGVKMPRLGTNDGKNAIIAIPPIKEQKRIRDKFDIITPLFDIIQKNINNLNNEVTAIKSKILDLAIRGKLVPQDPNDEPASVLLERIRAEKEELIKQGKIKRDKKESGIFKGDDNSYYEKINGNTVDITNQIPFDLPAGWAWDRLGNIVSIARGGSPRPIKSYLSTEANGVNWIKIGDAEKNGKYIFTTKEKIKPEGVSKSRYVKSGDFLLTNSMSFGRPYILKTDGCIHDGWLVIGNTEAVFNQDYLYYSLSADFMYKTLLSLASGSTVDNLNSDLVKSLLFPIPPLKEQSRIAEEVCKFENILSNVEASLN